MNTHADLLVKTLPKQDRVIFYQVNIKNTRSNTWKTHMPQQPPRKRCKNSNKIRIVPSSLSYRFLDNYRTKLPSQKLCKAEIYKKFKQSTYKTKTDERAQNATPVEETPCNHSKRDLCTLRRRSKCDLCRGNAV